MSFILRSSNDGSYYCGREGCVTTKEQQDACVFKDKDEAFWVKLAFAMDTGRTFEIVERVWMRI